MFDDLKMLNMIMAKPGIRTVELSDRLDCAIEEVTDALGGHVERRFLEEHKVIAPNGRKANAYTLAGVPLPDPAQTGPQMTDVEKAIAYIRSKPEQRASGAEVYYALDLHGQAPSVVLAEGLKDGRLVKDGKWWTLGACVALLVTAGVDVQADRVEVHPVYACIATAVGIPTEQFARDFANAPPRPKTKIQTAIDYLTEHGKTDTHTLRGVLGIKGKSAHPLSYLQDALSDRRIARKGNLWWVSGYEHVKAPAVAENPADIQRQLVSQLKQLEQSAIETALFVMHNSADVQEGEVVAEPLAEEAKPEVQTTILDQHSKYVETEMVAAAVHAMASEVQTTILDDEDHGHLNMPRQLVTEARKLLEQERKASEFACALWSDGELQLVRSGNTVATLTADEALHLSKYLKRTSLEVA